MSIKSKIQNLITEVNTVTCNSDSTLTSAIQSLVNGYGTGGTGGGFEKTETALAGGGTQVDITTLGKTVMTDSSGGKIYNFGGDE